jgi:Reverse transcriptase (RNA-dependent DNA polymerase)
MYMALPRGFNYKGSRKTHCLLLKRNLYGQKQAGRVWNQYLHDGLVARGFVQSQVDMCLYNRGKVALLVYTDDGIIVGPTPSDIDDIVNIIRSPVMDGNAVAHCAFNITNDGSITDYLGVNVNHLPNGTIKLLQPSLTQSILDDLGFNKRTTSKPTPAASTVNLHRDKHGQPYDEKWHYRSIIGKLNFLEKSTRPDIAFAVHQCARFCTDPKESHASAVKRIGKYLLATKDKGVILSQQDHLFDCFVDANFVGN